MSRGRLENRVVVITGGASGIGRASARLFTDEGARVVIADTNAAAGDAVIEQVQKAGAGTAISVETDVADSEQVRQLINRVIDEYGRVDALFGNAGILPLGTAWDTTVEDWQRCVAVNLGGNFYLAKYGVPALIDSGGGVILYTASELGKVGISGAAAYCASKAGLINLTRAIAIDSAPYGIRVNCIAPGPINTPMTTNSFARAEDPTALERAQTEPVLLKRLGTAEEIAKTALFLISDESSYMTGSIVTVDGGATA